MNQSKLEIGKKGMECLNMAVLGVNELKWTRMVHLQCSSLEMTSSEEMQWL